MEVENNNLCGNTHTAEYSNTEPCEQVSTNCVIYEGNLPELSLNDNPGLTSIINSIVSSLINLSSGGTSDIFVTLNTEQTIDSTALKTVRTGGKSWIFETDSNKITLGGNEDATALQPEPTDNGNLVIYGENDVKIVDIDGNYADPLSGLQGGYVGVYRGGNGAWAASMSCKISEKKNSIVLLEYTEDNMGDPTNPSVISERVVEIYSKKKSDNTLVGGIQINNPNGRIDLGTNRDYKPEYRFVNTFNTLLEDKLTIKSASNTEKRTEITENALLQMYAESTGKKTVDIDGEFFGGGYVGVYQRSNENVAVAMHAENHLGNFLNRLRVYEADPLNTEGTDNSVSLNLASESISGNSYNYLEIFGSNPEIVIGGRADKDTATHSLSVKEGDVKFYNNAEVVNNTKTGTVTYKIFTFSTLPIGEEGMVAYIDDANNITYRGIASGGGTEKALVFYNGTNWIYH